MNDQDLVEWMVSRDYSREFAEKAVLEYHAVFANKSPGDERVKTSRRGVVMAQPFDSFNQTVPKITSIEQREYDPLYDWNWWEVRVADGKIFRMAFSLSKTADDIRHTLENPSALRGPIRVDECEEVSVH